MSSFGDFGNKTGSFRSKIITPPRRNSNPLTTPPGTAPIEKGGPNYHDPTVPIGGKRNNGNNPLQPKGGGTSGNGGGGGTSGNGDTPGSLGNKGWGS